MGRWVALAGWLFTVGYAHPALADPLADALRGSWTMQATGPCRSHVYKLQLTGDVLHLTAPDGKTDDQRVLERRVDGVATETTRSTHDFPVGKKWVYEFLASDELSLTEGSSGQHAELRRCR